MCSIITVYRFYATTYSTFEVMSLILTSYQLNVLNLTQSQPLTYKLWASTSQLWIQSFSSLILLFLFSALFSHGDIFHGLHLSHFPALYIFVSLFIRVMSSNFTLSIHLFHFASRIVYRSWHTQCCLQPGIPH